jgi:cellulose synthase/poly-beta-1,6-N-acetylglucosamine synthase-like glycosyltransferase
VVYENRSECYEEVPENWRSRIRQIQRWAIGHNQALVRHSLPLLRKHDATWAQRIDGLFLLGVFAMPLVTLWAWGLALLGFYVDGSILGGVLPVLGMAAYASVGTFAAFFEIGAATRLDRVPRKILLLPLNIFGFIVSMISVTTATLSQILSRFLGGRMIWHKTGRTDNNHGRVR